MVMKRDEVLRILAAHRDELRREYSVKSLALFGSVARDEATGASDIDILVDFDRRVSLFDLIGLQLRLQDLLRVPKVDVVMRDAIYPAIKDDILSEAIDVGPRAPAGDCAALPDQQEEDEPRVSF
jgi:predicted nucleotidyltransferase